MSKFIVRRFLGAPEEPLTVENRARYAIFQGTMSIIGNIALAVLKLIFGILTNSIALLADALHTASDVLTSAIVILGFKVAKRPADMKHPYGHGRIEPIATLIISLLLIWAGIEFAHASYDRLRAPPRVAWNSMAFVLMIVSAVVKEWMARFAFAIGKMIKSDMLRADAWHHRTDAGASVFVAVSLLAAAFGYERVDSVFGFCVAGLIVYTGFELLWSMVSVLLGEAPSRDLIHRVMKAGLSVKGVEEVHDINVHDYGHRRVISLHVVIPGELKTARSHHLARLVEKAVGESVDASAVVHVDPSISPPSRPGREVVEGTLRKLVEGHSEIMGVEGLRVSQSGGVSSVEFNIVMHRDLSLGEAHEIGRQIADDLHKAIGDGNVTVHIKPQQSSG